MKLASLLIALSVCAAWRTACADLRMDEHIHSREAAGPGFLLVEDPLLKLLPSLRSELLPLIFPADGRLSSMFGPRRDPICGRWARHEGMDIARFRGAPVKAAAAGRVGLAGFQGACGITAAIEHGAGLTTRYCHMDRIDVCEGQIVAQGQKIGRMGSTGRATGPHLHFEVRQDGVPVDPAEHLYY
ncbi:MAG: M23 family metallopeptidase [Proteobacteria bacterium]|nr:M23 family metallopeptidase [Pseudomonadota bacterium]